MAKKRTSDAEGNKSVTIRNYLLKHPEAAPAHVARELAKDGVEVTPGFVSTIRWNMKKDGLLGETSAPAAAAPEAPAAADEKSGANKSEAVRDVIRKQPELRNKEVIAVLAAQGVHVLPTLVSNVRKRLIESQAAGEPAAPRRRGRPPRSAAAAAPVVAEAKAAPVVAEEKPAKKAVKKGKPGRKPKAVVAAAAAAAAPAAPVAVAAAAPSVNGLSGVTYESIQAAKRLVDAVGGSYDSARSALLALENIRAAGA